jgi:hypothetical protein
VLATERFFALPHHNLRTGLPEAQNRVKEFWQRAIEPPQVKLVSPLREPGTLILIRDLRSANGLHRGTLWVLYKLDQIR